MGGYARTKREAEVLVAAANERPLKNGSANLRTVILRPSVMYGEQDPYFVSEILAVTKSQGGTLTRVDNIFTRCQMTYVGNAAWACLKVCK